MNGMVDFTGTLVDFKDSRTWNFDADDPWSFDFDKAAWFKTDEDWSYVTIRGNIKALTSSIEKWDDIVNLGPYGDYGPNNCPLCENHKVEGSLMCSTCPIAEFTGENSCKNSPYQEWLQHQMEEHGCRIGKPEDFYDEHNNCKVCGRSRYVVEPLQPLLTFKGVSPDMKNDDLKKTFEKLYEESEKEETPEGTNDRNFEWDIWNELSPLHVHVGCKRCKELALKEKLFLEEIRDHLIFGEIGSVMDEYKYEPPKMTAFYDPELNTLYEPEKKTRRPRKLKLISKIISALRHTGKVRVRGKDMKLVPGFKGIYEYDVWNTMVKVYRRDTHARADIMVSRNQIYVRWLFQHDEEMRNDIRKAMTMLEVPVYYSDDYSRETARKIREMFGNGESEEPEDEMAYIYEHFAEMDQEQDQF
jgi:hypothetical protein